MLNYRSLILALALPAGAHAIAQTETTDQPVEVEAEAEAAQPAQDASVDSRRLGAVVVTAQRRAERLQDVPIAVSVLGGEEALEKGVTSTQDLTANVPGLVVNVNANVGNLYLRGVGSNLPSPTDEQPTATYVDGSYIPFPTANFFTFNDVERIEVLKGPQGTLFGRNATGGVVQIITRKPSQDPALDASLTYGNYDASSVQLYGTTGLTDTVAVGLSAQYANQGDGFGTNLVSNEDVYMQAIDNFSARGKVLITPADGTEVLLTADYSNLRNSSPYQLTEDETGVDGVTTYPGDHNSTNDFPMFNPFEGFGLSAKVDQAIGGVDFTSISSYREVKGSFISDTDYVPLPIAHFIFATRGHAFSQELQLAGASDNFNWIVGAYYFDIFGQANLLTAATTPPTSLLRSEQEGRSLAGFAQGTYDFGTGTSLTLGARYTKEWQNFSYPAGGLTDNQDFAEPSWRAALDHKFSDNLMIYVSYNNSFKSGGYNLASPSLFGGVINKFNPEVLQSYEAGMKSQWLEDRLRLNVTAFHYIYDDIQTALVIPGGLLTLNAAEAHTDGLEVDFAARPTESLELSGGFSIMKGEYDSYPNSPAIGANAVQTTIDASGNELLVTPRYTGSLTATWNIPLDNGSLIRPSVTAAYNDGFYWFSDNRLKSPAYTLINAQIAWTSPDEKYGVRLWGKNLTDEYYYAARLARAGIGDSQVPAAPATFGITLTAAF